jgi:hypothetical protein
VSGYGLDNQTIEVRSPAETKIFPLSSVSRPPLEPTHSLLYNGCQGSFPRGKARLGRDADHSPPSSAKVMNRSYISSPLLCLHRCCGTALPIRAVAVNVQHNPVETLSVCALSYSVGYILAREGISKCFTNNKRFRCEVIFENEHVLRFCATGTSSGLATKFSLARVSWDRTCFWFVFVSYYVIVVGLRCTWHTLYVYMCVHI